MNHALLHTQQSDISDEAVEARVSIIKASRTPEDADAIISESLTWDRLCDLVFDGIDGEGSSELATFKAAVDFIDSVRASVRTVARDQLIVEGRRSR